MYKLLFLFFVYVFVLFCFNFTYLKISHVQEELGCGTQDSNGKSPEKPLLIIIRNFKWDILKSEMGILVSSE